MANNPRCLHTTSSSFSTPFTGHFPHTYFTSKTPPATPLPPHSEADFSDSSSPPHALQSAQRTPQQRRGELTVRTAIRNLQMTNFYVAILYDFLTFHPASLGALPETTACTARDRGQLKLYCRDLSHLDHPLSLMCTLCPVYTSKILLTTPQPFALDLSFVSRRSIMASHPAAAADDTISDPVITSNQRLTPQPAVHSTPASASTTQIPRHTFFQAMDPSTWHHPLPISPRSSPTSWNTRWQMALYQIPPGLWTTTPTGSSTSSTSL